MAITVTLTVDINPSDYLQTVTFTATLSESQSGIVNFFTGSQQFGGVITYTPATVITFATTLLPVGSNDITAVFTPYGSQTSYTSNDIFEDINPISQTIIGPFQSGETPASTVVNSTSTQILAANPSRTSMVVTNISFETISLGFGNPAVLFNGVTLGPGGSASLDILDNGTEAIYAISTETAGGGYVALQEMI